MSFDLAMLCALEIEAGPIVTSLQLTEKESPFDSRLAFKFFSSDSLNISLIQFSKCPIFKVDRIGTQIAAIAAWETIRHLKPKMIASVGTAGGFKSKGASIGDVFISDSGICFHGRHIPVPEYKSYELGQFPSFALNNLGPIKKGLVSSGDSIPLNENDQKRMLEIGTDAKDMESAAIAEVAFLTKVPMFAVKSISDFVDSDERTHSQFLANFKNATESLAHAMSFLVNNNHFG